MDRTCSVVQGAHSATFSIPPLDGSLTFPELLAFHATHSHSHKLFVYPDDGEVKSIDYATAFRAQILAARVVKRAFGAGSHLYIDKTVRPVFGILAIADTVTYATLIFGIEQTGAVPFPISTRNSAAALSHLLRTTGVHQVFVSENATMHALASEAAELLAKDAYSVELLDLPRFEDLYCDTALSMTLDDCRISPLCQDAPVIILHSSGTTAFPKPIKMIGRNYIAWGTSPYYGELDICGTRLGIQTSPTFHAMVNLMFFWAVCCGLELAVFKPACSPVIPNATSFLNDLVASRSDWALSVPALMEEWAQDPESVQLLKKHIKRIIFGGSQLNKQAGDVFHAEGIFLDSLYGLTEAGAMIKMPVAYQSRPADWEYFRLPDKEYMGIELVPHAGHRMFWEPVAMVGERYSPNAVNTTINGKPGYATGDLLEEHPSHKGLYKVHGRVDEQIVLSTGEKTNPVPLERILVGDTNIHIAVFFGRGRFSNGVLVQPTEPVDPKDVEKVHGFRNMIWPTVKRMNDYAPAHSRLLKHMILVANPEKPLELTAKGSARRNVCLAKYEEEIEAIYKEAEIAQDEPQPPATWTPESTLEFVQAVVEAAMDQKVAENDELFSLGCDSLAASSVRNNIVHALRTSASTSVPDLARKVPQNIVYQNPSVHALSAFVFALVTGRDLESDAEAILRQKAQAMEAMVAKYSVDLPSPRIPVGSPLTGKETVLVTGTTGRLGCHLLAQLCQDPKVRHVYALNRASAGKASPEALAKRIRSAFESWELDPALIGGGKVTLLASDYAAERLGLDPSMYTEIESQLTTIIHNAWRVDFNVALSGYEPLIAGVRRLVNLASTCSAPGGARVLFVSSVSVLFGTPSDRPSLEEPILNARLSAGMGYGESKWVAETLLLRARNAVGLRAATVRVGQLAGDTHVGGWNKQEWVGAIARLGQIVKALPEREEPISWVPVDIAATALIDIARSEEPVFNLVSPVPSDWRTVFGAFAKRLELPLIKYDEWAARVRGAAETNTREEDMQPLALADFFQAGNFGEGVAISTERACQVSPALANVSPIGEKDVALYVDYWKKIGFLHA